MSIYNLQQNLDRENEIIKELQNFQLKDFHFNSGRILGSMCSEPHPIAKKAYELFLDTNIGDPKLFKGTREIEKRYLFFIQNLLNAPPTATGLTVSGGTEGNITGMWVAKQLSQNQEILIPASAHFSFQKIAALMDMKLKPIPLTKKFEMDISQVKKRITPHTAAIVGIAGSTDLGVVDPISQIGEICDEEHIYFHVDAAFGGFVIPFLEKLGYTSTQFDFSVSSVSSISVDAHKMGLAAIPLGTLILREREWLDEISVQSSCINSAKQAGILGTRSGGPIAAGYAVTRYLGLEGYQKIVEHCMDTTFYAYDLIQNIGLSFVRDPYLNVLCIRLKKPQKVVFMLEQRGWRVNHIDHLSSIRIVCMPQITKEHIDEFVTVLKEVCIEAGEL
jgi:tyrosine decarboxylase/aspartate 1-decarboxylase